MDIKNIDKVLEIKRAMNFLAETRARFVDSMCDMRDHQENKAQEVNNALRNGFVNLENEILKKLEEELKEL